MTDIKKDTYKLYSTINIIDFRNATDDNLTYLSEIPYIHVNAYHSTYDLRLIFKNIISLAYSGTINLSNFPKLRKINILHNNLTGVCNNPVVITIEDIKFLSY